MLNSRKKRKVSQAANGEGSSGGVISDVLKDGEEKLAEDVVEAAVEQKDEIKKEGATAKPYFQITGDETMQLMQQRRRKRTTSPPPSRSWMLRVCC